MRKKSKKVPKLFLGQVPALHVESPVDLKQCQVSVALITAFPCPTCLKYELQKTATRCSGVEDDFGALIMVRPTISWFSASGRSTLI